jgi:hypothetical protein
MNNWAQLAGESFESDAMRNKASCEKQVEAAISATSSERACIGRIQASQQQTAFDDEGQATTVDRVGDHRLGTP